MQDEPVDLSKKTNGHQECGVDLSCAVNGEFQPVGRRFDEAPVVGAVITSGDSV